ncbi:hypothetical protein E2I00_019341 [Balaenoptera physalus]|uniref:C2 domain-containing protein n=1 Tax=Balaenoptera physalus TaxID=9770 RepID=A0A643BQP3_BALPH|nr:hypothetical protein E2I00_019341 [Balaenoptera physalus]
MFSAAAPHPAYSHKALTPLPGHPGGGLTAVTAPPGQPGAEDGAEPVMRWLQLPGCGGNFMTSSGEMMTQAVAFTDQHCSHILDSKQMCFGFSRSQGTSAGPSGLVSAPVAGVMAVDGAGFRPSAPGSSLSGEPGAALPLCCAHRLFIKSPPDWEVGVYAAGALALLGIAAVSLWKLWTSGSFPSPSPFPNYDYRYLQQKYGENYAEARQKRVPAWNAQRTSTRGPPSRKGSLSIEDTFESISELGPLELMGRELDLAPYGALRKSQSADSLNSISSVSNTFGQDFTLGQVEVSMDYDAASHTLHIQRNAYSIFFDEKFSIPLDPAALEEKSLRFSVFGIDEDERNVSTGVVELKLSVLDLPLQPFGGWLYLQDQNKRLTVVVVKAKNLIWTNDKTTADPFVKVYLLQDGRKMSKKKTAVKRDDPNPVFNEAMIFSVPAIVLQDLSLRVTVAESSSDGRGDNVGHVIIGPSASGMGTTHWNQMLATLRRPVSMWHPVRRN